MAKEAPIEAAAEADGEAPAGTPIRDERAFSLDPSTGAPAGNLAEVNRGTAAMQALDQGQIDDHQFNAIMAGETSLEEARPETSAEEAQGATVSGGGAKGQESSGAADSGAAPGPDTTSAAEA